MALTEADVTWLRRCVELARAALDDGDEPFGSVLVNAQGTALFEDHNHVSGGDATRHPELAIAHWSVANLSPAERAACTVYTSGEHCAMCAAGHAWVGLGRIVYATSSQQLSSWLTEWGSPKAPVAPLPIRTVAPGLVVDGPAEALEEEMKGLYARKFRP